MSKSFKKEEEQQKQSLIDSTLSRPAFSDLFRTCLNQPNAVYTRNYPFRFSGPSIFTIGSNIGSPNNRLQLVAGARLCSTLAKRLLCMSGPLNSKEFMQYFTATFSRRRRCFNEEDRMDTLAGHKRYSCIYSVACDISGEFLVSGSSDKTAKLWCVSKPNMKATCVANLGDHLDSVHSVAFHPGQGDRCTIATGSYDNGVRLCSFSKKGAIAACEAACEAPCEATCDASLKGHTSHVESVIFNEYGTLLASTSKDGIAIIWRLSDDRMGAVCMSTLRGHGCGISSGVFHPTKPVFVTSSWDNTVKFWRFSENGEGAVCVLTLRGHRDHVLSVAFNKSGSILATGSTDGTAILWRVSEDCTRATPVATLTGHFDVSSMVFHRSANLLATASSDGTVKLWMFLENGTAATCVKTLRENSRSHGNCLAFHPTEPVLLFGSSETIKLYK